MSEIFGRRIRTRLLPSIETNTLIFYWQLLVYGYFPKSNKLGCPRKLIVSPRYHHSHRRAFLCGTMQLERLENSWNGSRPFRIVFHEPPHSAQIALEPSPTERNNFNDTLFGIGSRLLGGEGSIRRVSVAACEIRNEQTFKLGR